MPPLPAFRTPAVLVLTFYNGMPADSIEKPITWNLTMELLTKPQLAALPLPELPPPTLQSLVTAKLDFPLIEVPEPAAYLLIGLGLIVVSTIRPRKHAARSYARGAWSASRMTC